MNKKLKFSWGHIIAFLALIFISYVAYMGDFYLNGGNFEESILKVLILIVILLATFIGAQIQKGTDQNFKRSLTFERVLICLAPIVFIVAMVLNNHFWNVYHQKDEIENLFNRSISESQQMFNDYDEYAKQRISNYSEMLDDVVLNKESDLASYVESGFNGVNDPIRKENYVNTLKLQLLSTNSASLRAAATNWINQANQGASVWNVFLIGNVKQISEAITDWNTALIDYTRPVLSNETLRGNVVSPFDLNKSSIEKSTSGLKSLTGIYIKSGGINFMIIILAPILFLMLLFPYLLQKRNTKAIGLYRLLPVMNNQGEKESFHAIAEPQMNQTLQKEKGNNPYDGTF